jgi:hypothetical protein
MWLIAMALGDGALGASLARKAMFFVGAALLRLSRSDSRRQSRCRSRTSSSSACSVAAQAGPRSGGRWSVDRPIRLR